MHLSADGYEVHMARRVSTPLAHCEHMLFQKGLISFISDTISVGILRLQVKWHQVAPSGTKWHQVGRSAKWLQCNIHLDLP